MSIVLKGIELRIALTCREVVLLYALWSSPGVISRSSIYMSSLGHLLHRNPISVLDYTDDVQLHLLCNSQNPQGFDCHHKYSKVDGSMFYTARCKSNRNICNFFKWKCKFMNYILSKTQNVIKYCRQSGFFLFTVATTRQVEASLESKAVLFKIEAVMPLLKHGLCYPCIYHILPSVL